jgi:alpha-galactosidase
MLAAPLMAGNDLHKMSEQTRDILTNKEIIAIDQDALGIEGFRYYSFDGLEIFVKPLSNDDLAVCFLNRSDHTQNINYEWIAHTIQDKVSNTDADFVKTTYKLRDVWAKKDIGTTQKALKRSIAAHDVIVLKLSK